MNSKCNRVNQCLVKTVSWLWSFLILNTVDSLYFDLAPRMTAYLC